MDPIQVQRTVCDEFLRPENGTGWGGGGGGTVVRAHYDNRP